MSGPNLRACYESSFTATDNVVQECATCSLQCKILFSAEGIKNMATFHGKPITYILKTAGSHMEFGYIGKIIALKI